MVAHPRSGASPGPLRHSRPLGADAGMVTMETALAIPVVVLAGLVGLGLSVLGMEQVRAEAHALQVARLAARDGWSPGSSVAGSRAGDMIRVERPADSGLGDSGLGAIGAVQVDLTRRVRILPFGEGLGVWSLNASATVLVEAP